MPHSTASEPIFSPEAADEDITLPDAPLPEPISESEEGENGEEGQDRERSQEGIAQANGAAKPDVKLEDLFNDDDSEDEEFPSSSIPSAKGESSPPAAPM